MLRFVFVGVAAAAIIVWLLIGILADRSVALAVSRDAVDKALHWGSYISTHVPDLPRLVETGDPTPEQKDAIRSARKLGDIFRFKLFDAQGRLVLVSDESFVSNPTGVAAATDAEPLIVLQTGVEIVDVFDGTAKPDRPDLYAEAYVPLTDQDGTVFGVAEVYVNETQTQQYFTDSFENFGFFVSLISAILFLVPALGFGIQRQLTQRSRTEAEYLAKYDTLTGLLNRAEFNRQAQALVKENTISALLFLDADKFKVINDTHGHGVGDKFLEQIGRVLTANVDSRDLVARFGGDEFVVVMTNVDHETIARRVRAISTRCAEPLDVGDRTITSSVSIGVSLPDQSTSLEDALAQADAALYFAKSGGRNRYAFYGDAMGSEIRRRNLLEARIKEAAMNEEFTIDYQPLVDGQSHEPVGYEALLRLSFADGESVPPSEFISVAEEIGLIDQIGKWAINEATRKIAGLPGTLKVAINLSAAQFQSGKLPKIVADALSASGLPANRLELEITESLLLNDDTAIPFQIDAIQDMGVSIAMDDFGTGFSSLGYLWKYGFDRIKIDRSFVSGLVENSQRSREIIETVVMLGKRLGMQVTAEGVETQAQSDILSDLGCDVLQGFLYGRPAGISGHTDSKNSVTKTRDVSG